MRALCLLIMFVATTHAGAHEHLVSPDGKFEAYTTANWPDGTGMKLYLRRAQSRDAGVLLWQNNRWLEPKWSPDSRFLALIDHPDGHVSDVYVFGVTAPDAAAPNMKWASRLRAIISDSEGNRIALHSHGA